MEDSRKEHIHKVRSEAGKKGGKIGGKITGKITGPILGKKYGKIGGKVPGSVYVRQTKEPYIPQNIDLPEDLLDSIKKKGKVYSNFIIGNLLPIIVDLEELRTAFIPEYIELLKDKEWRILPKRAVTLHRGFLERVENLVGKKNRAKFITAYLSKILN